MKMTGRTSNCEEVSSQYTDLQSVHGIDAVKQHRGQLSFRSRKLLHLFQKNDGREEGEKQSTPASSARDVRLEVIASPPVETKKQEPKKIGTVRRNGISVLNGKPGKAIEAFDGSSRKVVADVQTKPTKKQLLPARLKLLETFYEGVETAVSLLAIRRQMCTFKSVCKTVEQMSKRRFLRSHLAQLKFLFPEAIDIDYARVPDQDSRRDVWDVRILLKNYPVIPGESPLKGAASPSQNAQTLRRKKEFLSRLLKFASSNNEDVDVPQYPFPQRPLGGQSLSSPNVSSDSRSIDVPFSSYAGDIKQNTSTTLEAAASRVNGEHLKDAAENHDAPREADIFISTAKPVDTVSIVSDISSHFPHFFKPHFKERGGELKSMEKPVTGTIPSEVHLQTSAISSRRIKHFSRIIETNSSNSTEEGGTREDLSEPSPSENSFQSRNKNSSNFTEEEGAREDLSETSPPDNSFQSPHRNRKIAPQLNLENSFQSPGLIAEQLSCSSSNVNEMATDNSPSVPALRTPGFLSPSYQYNPVSENGKRSDFTDLRVHARGQGTMRSLQFASPIRQAEVFAPRTPQLGTSLELTPKDVSKSGSFVSTPQETTPETLLGKSSFFSPVKPQRSRALRFSTPEKVPLSSSQQHFKSTQTSTPGSGMRKPPRFLSPPRTEILSAPATPVPLTPLRSVVFSPPKRTKLSLFPNEKSQEEQVQVSQSLTPEVQKHEASKDIGCETPGLDLGAVTVTHIHGGDNFATPAKTVKALSYASKSDLAITDSLPEGLAPSVEDSFTTPAKTVRALNYVSKSDLAIIDSLPEGLVHSVREKERKLKNENTKELILQKRKQQMMAGLPKMFNQIRMIFQSMKRSVLPRNELIKNVLSTNHDITDRVEVEERLKLLTELAPDWITKQPSANGDYIYRINKTANVTKTQKKILEAC